MSFMDRKIANRVAISLAKKRCLLNFGEFSIPFLLALLSHCVTSISVTSQGKFLKGENATLYCIGTPTIKENTVPPTYTWTREDENGQVIIATSVSGISSASDDLDEDIKVRLTFEPPFLYIRNLEVTDSGRYTCQAIVAGKPIETNSTMLKVNAIPTISVKNVLFPNINENSRRYVAAVCQAKEGKPPAKLTWLQTDTGEQRESSETIIKMPDGTFTVKSQLLLFPGLIGRLPNATDPVTIDDERKNFTCQVSHSEFPNEEERYFHVAIHLLYAPVVTISIESNRLQCNAWGNPKPRITWTRPNGKVQANQDEIFVDQKSPRFASGIYVCLAKSSIAPEVIASVDVLNSRALPTLFTSSLRYNTSLPVTARGYQMECSAEVETRLDNDEVRVGFEWNKDGRFIKPQDSPYSVDHKLVKISKEKSIVTSVLTLTDVRRYRDQGTFTCRLIMTSLSAGFVRAVERSVHINVDYPPTDISVGISPQKYTTVLEHTDVTLSCNAISSPPSSYQWYFKGTRISSDSLLNLRNISRNQAGTYICIAFNYVPGSVRREVTLTVQYPPNAVAIIRSSRLSLSCFAIRGSVPPPVYQWYLPNGTFTSGNMSTLPLEDADVTSAAAYTCIVSNRLSKPINYTYQVKLEETGGIGLLSVSEFIVIIIFCVLVLILLALAVVWNYRKNFLKQNEIIASKPNSNCNTSQLLQYNEPPQGGSVGNLPAIENNAATESWVTNSRNGLASDMNGRHPVMSPSVAGKPALINYVTLVSKSNLLVSQEQGATTMERNSKYRSVDELNNSSIEIIENGSMNSVHSGTDKQGITPIDVDKAENKLSGHDLNKPKKGIGEITQIGNPPLYHYSTIRLPSRALAHERVLTRALSEGFKPALCNDVRQPGKDATLEMSEANKIISNIRQSHPQAMAVTEASLPAPNNGINLPENSPSTSFSSPQETEKGDQKNASHTSDSLSVSSCAPRLRSDLPTSSFYSPMTGIMASSEVCIGKEHHTGHPPYLYNAVTHDPYSTYSPNHEYRPSSSPSPRCRSVEPHYDHGFSPSCDMPIRSFVCQPYIETRRGMPTYPAQQVPRNITNISSPYDSGSDSAKSSSTATTGGRRMQSLTLV